MEKFIKKISKLAQDQSANSNIVLLESLNGIRNVKSIVNEVFEFKSFKKSSEYIVQDTLNKLLKNRTSIIIAHKLSSIKNAENILVLENVEFKENGTHDF